MFWLALLLAVASVQALTFRLVPSQKNATLCAMTRECDTVSEVLRNLPAPSGNASNAIEHELLLPAGVLTYDDISSDGLTAWNNLTATFNNVALALHAENGTCVFDGRNSDRLFVVSGSTLSFVNVEFRRARRPFQAQQSTLTFTNCTFADNRVTGTGGALWVRNESVRLIR